MQGNVNPSVRVCVISLWTSSDEEKQTSCVVAKLRCDEDRGLAVPGVSSHYEGLKSCLMSTSQRPKALSDVIDFEVRPRRKRCLTVRRGGANSL